MKTHSRNNGTVGSKTAEISKSLKSKDKVLASATSQDRTQPITMQQKH